MNERTLKILKAANEQFHSSTELRAGQCLFNAAADELRSDDCYMMFNEKFRGTNIDCFYKDSQILDFLIELDEFLSLGD